MRSDPKYGYVQHGAYRVVITLHPKRPYAVEDTRSGDIVGREHSFVEAEAHAKAKARATR